MKIRFQVHNKTERMHGKDRVVDLQLLIVPEKDQPFPPTVNPHGVLNFGGLIGAEGDKLALGQEFYLELTAAPPPPEPEPAAAPEVPAAS